MISSTGGPGCKRKWNKTESISLYASENQTNAILDTWVTKLLTQELFVYSTSNNVLTEKRSQTTEQITYHCLEGLETRRKQDIGKKLVYI